MFEIKNLNKAYKDKKVLDHISLTVYPYEIHAVLGRNGCGKTTLFKCIMGLVGKDSGEMLFDGKILNFEVRSRFGYMPERRSLLPDLSMRDHLSLMGQLKHMSESEIEERVLKLSEDFELETFLDRSIQSLSKGQQQKTQLMIALMNQPECLILDEPLSGLDVDSVDFFLRALKKYASDGHSILISSHQMEFMDALCTHILLLENGVVKQAGRLNDIKDQSGVSIRINASAQWQSLSPFADNIESFGAFVFLYADTASKAKRLLSKATKCEGLSQLRLSPLSVAELLKEKT